MNASKRNRENKIHLKLQHQQLHHRRDQEGGTGVKDTSKYAFAKGSVRKWNVEGGKDPK
jgi:hypothetical protein